jgi:hypothetical protein
MEMRVAVLTLVMLVSGVSDGSAQQLITMCGPSSGKAYTMDNNQWSNDEGPHASNKATTFFRYPNGEYDIIYKGEIGGGSEREQGSKIFRVHGEDDRLLTLLSVSPQRTTEVFQLTLDASGQGTLIWSIFKNKDGPYGLTFGELSFAKCSR